MYQAFFGFTEPPFRITPDPRFLYRNPDWEAAAGALAEGIVGRQGFLALVGEVGTGKTTLVRHLLESLPATVRTVLLMHPTVTFDETLDHLVLELGIPVAGASKLDLLQRLNEFVLEHAFAGGNVVLIFDESQALEPAALAELALLAQLRTHQDEPAVQILLAGQPELEEKLALPELAALREQVSVHVRLHPFSPDEVAEYVRTRLRHAGAPDAELFTPEAMGRLAELSGGVPRLVNVLCDAALMTAFAQTRRQVTAETVDEAWADYAPLASPQGTPMPRAVDPPGAPAGPATAGAAPEPTSRRLRIAPAAAAAVAVLLVLAVGGLALHLRAPTPPAVTATAKKEPPTDTPTAPTPDHAAATPSAAAPPVAAARAPLPSEHGGTASSSGDRTPDAAPVVVEGPTPSVTEALEVVDAFRAAYEARDVTRLGTLFAADAVENGRRGRDAIAARYATVFAGVDEVAYYQPTASVEPLGTRIGVRAPFVITYRDDAGKRSEVRGMSAWQIARRDGVPRIVTLDYAFEQPARP